MAGDLLDKLIAQARDRVPGVPDEVWRAIEAELRAKEGGTRGAYIRRKTVEQTKSGVLQRLEQAAQEQEATSTAQLAQRLGVGVRTVERYIPLIKGD